MNGETILSREGTTQGDPLGMLTYTISIRPLIKHLESIDTQQIWYVDDSAVGGDLDQLKTWCMELCRLGPNLDISQTA